MEFSLSFGYELEDMVNNLLTTNDNSKQEIKKEKYQKHKVLFESFDLNIRYFSIPEKCICGSQLNNIKMIVEYPMVMPILPCDCGITNYPTKKI
jgi:hypothetical protein